MHLCWGNYEGPHHYDVAAGRHHRHRLRRAAAGACRFEAANPRHAHEWRVFERVKLPGGQGAHPRRPRLDDQLHRAPGPRRRAHRPLRAAGRARERHRRNATADSAPGSGRPRSIRTSRGRSSRAWPKAPGAPRGNSGRSERAPASSSRSAAICPSIAESNSSRSVVYQSQSPARQRLERRAEVPGDPGQNTDLVGAGVSVRASRCAW